jgi:predicted AAA+ superfamily ATPase
MYPRHLHQSLTQAFADTPVILLTGARQTGKSTLARLARPEALHLTFDDLDTLAQARTDPIGFLSGLPRYVVIDEVQRLPELFLPLKALVDKERLPGRFLLTGSANVLALPRLADSLAGRMGLLKLWPLSQGEIESRLERFIDLAFSKELPPLDLVGSTDLVPRLLRGGYPEVLARESDRRREVWFADYLTTLIERDVRDLSAIEGLTDLPRLLRLLAARTAGLVSQADIARDAALNPKTFKRYFDLLQTTYLLYTLPPWFSNLGKRLVKAPKVYVSDSGVASYLQGVNETRLVSERGLQGPLLETFVAAELQKQLGWSETLASLYHYRSHDGDEVDLVLEDKAGRLVGIEVKATATPLPDDFKGLRRFARDVGERFYRGFVLHTGTRVTGAGENLWALPVNALWEWR